MNLIEELKNYCAINNPVGALMLSGEWGCGKTYLIKSLRKESKVVQTKKQYGDFSLTALSFASISIFSG